MVTKFNGSHLKYIYLQFKMRGALLPKQQRTQILATVSNRFLVLSLKTHGEYRIINIDS